MDRVVPARLIWLKQVAEPITLVETTDGLTLGRARDNDIVLEDPNVSGMHAVFEMRGTHWVITDTSLNGTELRSPGQSPVLLHGRSRNLRHNDELAFGNTPFRFHFNKALGDDEIEITPPLGGKVGLTPSQHDVLMELSRPLRKEPGKPPASNDDIGAALHLSEGGVRRHLKTLYGLFGLVEGTQTQRRAELANQWWRAEIRRGAQQD